MVSCDSCARSIILKKTSPAIVVPVQGKQYIAYLCVGCMVMAMDLLKLITFFGPAGETLRAEAVIEAVKRG